MFDYGEHGTHVCGIIAGSHDKKGIAIGVAPEAILCVAALRLNDIEFSEVIEAMAWMIANGAHIINLSLGFEDNVDYDFCSELFDVIVNKYNVLPIAACGNRGVGISDIPSNLKQSFSVGSYYINKYKREDVAVDSGGASIILPGTSKEDMIITPTVVAPGRYIYSSIPSKRYPFGNHNYGIMSGTSQATAFVSGSVALLMAANPKISIKKIVNAIKITARHPLGKKLRDNRWGYGVIQPWQAHNQLNS